MAESVASLFYVPCWLAFHQYYEGSFSFQITLGKPKRRQRREREKEEEEVVTTVMRKKFLLPQSGTNELNADERLGEGGVVSCTPLTPALKGTETRGSLGLAGYQHR